MVAPMVVFFIVGLLIASVFLILVGNHLEKNFRSREVLQIVDVVLIDNNNINNIEGQDNDLVLISSAEADLKAKQSTNDSASYNITVEKYYTLRLAKIKQVCGKACSPIPSNIAKQLIRQNYALETQDLLKAIALLPEKNKIDCANLFSKTGEALFDRMIAIWPPPETIPSALLPAYTNDGVISILPMYMRAKYTGNDNFFAKEWEKKNIDEAIQDVGHELGKYRASYGRRATSVFRRFLLENVNQIQGKHGLIVGSERPWLEVSN